MKGFGRLSKAFSATVLAIDVPCNRLVTFQNTLTHVRGASCLFFDAREYLKPGPLWADRVWLRVYCLADK